jgi:hypothetical protein
MPSAKRSDVEQLRELSPKAGRVRKFQGSHLVGACSCDVRNLPEVLAPLLLLRIRCCCLVLSHLPAHLFVVLEHWQQHHRGALLLPLQQQLHVLHGVGLADELLGQHHHHWGGGEGAGAKKGELSAELVKDQGKESSKRSVRKGSVDGCGSPMVFLIASVRNIYYVGVWVGRHLYARQQG